MVMITQTWHAREIKRQFVHLTNLRASLRSEDNWLILKVHYFFYSLFAS